MFTQIGAPMTEIDKSNALKKIPISFLLMINRLCSLIMYLHPQKIADIVFGIRMILVFVTQL